MRLMDKMKQKRMENKGFTLVELIIVMAIMAVLLGIVGTQVIPYLERAREAKDLQILNSYCTAAVTTYAYHAEDFIEDEGAGHSFWCSVYGTTSYTTMPEWFGDKTAKKINDDATKSAYFMDEITELVGYSDISAMKAAMHSKKSEKITDIVIENYMKKGTVTAHAVDSSGNPVLDPVVSYLGHDGD